MASESVIVELLRQAEAQRNQPSQFQQGLAQTSQVMQGLIQGLQLYDAVKSLPYKYGTAGKPGAASTAPAAPVAGQSLSPVIPTSASALPAGGTAGASSMDPSVILSQAMQASATPAQAPSSSMAGTLGTAAYDLINKAGETYPGMGRAAAQQFGVDPGLSKTEITAQAQQLYTLLDPMGNVIKQFAQPKGGKIDRQSGPLEGNILQVGKGGKVTDIGNRKAGDVVVKESSEGSGKTPEDKEREILSKVEDDARAIANNRSNDMGLFDAKIFDREFKSEYSKLLNQRLTGVSAERKQQIIAQRFAQPIADPNAYRQANATFIQQVRERVAQLRLTPKYNPIAMRKELLGYGMPDDVISEVMQ